MNPDTGEIRKLIEMSEEEKKTYVPIPEDQLKRVTRMNRKARRAWAAQQKKRKKNVKD